MKSHWLYSTAVIRKIWIGSGVVLLFTVVAELFVKLHPHFAIAGQFAFYAVFGFISCVAMILFAKLLGYLIKRRDDYYDN